MSSSRLTTVLGHSTEPSRQDEDHYNPLPCRSHQDKSLIQSHHNSVSEFPRRTAMHCYREIFPETCRHRSVVPSGIAHASEDRVAGTLSETLSETPYGTLPLSPSMKPTGVPSIPFPGTFPIPFLWH